MYVSCVYLKSLEVKQLQLSDKCREVKSKYFQWNVNVVETLSTNTWKRPYWSTLIHFSSSVGREGDVIVRLHVCV